MQAHVDQRELHLAQRLQAAVEVLGREHAIEQGARQRRAAVDMRPTGAAAPPTPTQVLHELAGQLDRIPLDAGDARHAEIVDAREQVVQAVAELVEQRLHVVVRQQRGAAVQRRREVAHQVRHRRLQLAAGRSQRSRVPSIQAPGRLPARACGSR